jgi:hypothetical protein
MATTSRQTPTALLDLPAVPDSSALKAGLIAMRMEAAPARSLPQAFERLLADPHSVLFVDISVGVRPNTLTLLELDAKAPKGDVRRRILLTRLASGHVSAADQQWVQSLGFGGLWSDFNPLEPEGELRSAVDFVADSLGLSKVDAPELARYARVLNADRAPDSPRAVVWDATGKSAERTVAVLLRALDIRDRTYRLRSYPQCFVGSEAVKSMVKQYKCSPDAAVAVGQALGRLGLLVHVTHDHPFLNEDLYYRLTYAAHADSLDLGAAYTALTQTPGVVVTDREYLGRVYPQCWVGSDAVDLLAEQFETRRLEACIALHRLAQFGLLEHVTKARPFADGNYFYRFVGSAT